jgi:hydroxymethylglutaryl-CoA lyase
LRVKIYEVGPRDGLQALSHFVDTATKIELINTLYTAGLNDIEETSFAHPRLVPQMADAEDVFSGGSVLVMNKRGYERAKSVGAKKINIVFSPCEEFNKRNLGKTRDELYEEYSSFMGEVDKEDVRVYLSMAFGSPYGGAVNFDLMKECIDDAKMFGNTVVFADTVGVGSTEEVAIYANMALEVNMTPALHLHHTGDEERAIDLVYAGINHGIREFDSSIGGLGGCPFAEESGANLSTETLVRYLNGWGCDTGIHQDDLISALRIVSDIRLKSVMAI